MGVAGGDVPLMVVAQNLGHRDTTMVEHHYGRLAPSFKRDAIRGKADVWISAGKGQRQAAAVA